MFRSVLTCVSFTLKKLVLNNNGRGNYFVMSNNVNTLYIEYNLVQ